MSGNNKNWFIPIVFLSIGLVLLSLSVIINSNRISTLEGKLKVYDELDRIWDAKAYCAEYVRAPKKCHITVSVQGIK